SSFLRGSYFFVTFVPAVRPSWLLRDDGQLRDDVDERIEGRGAAEAIGGGHRVAEAPGLRVHRHDPDAGPHLRRLPWILVRRESADAAPARREVDGPAHVVDVNHHRRAVLGLARAAVDGGHAEADLLAALEAVGQDAVGRRRSRLVEAGEVAPDHQLALAMPWLRRRWWRRLAASTSAAAPLGGLLLPRDGGRERHRHRQRAGEEQEGAQTSAH